MPETALRRRDLIAEGAAALRAGGLPAPRREAFGIWREVSREPLDIGPEGQDAVDSAVTVAFRRAIARRAAGEPLAYVTGWSGFRHLTLWCDPRALIPRPETEGLVDLLLTRTRQGRVADLGTGTGCLALSLAREGGFSDVVGVDLSAAALSLAAENMARTGKQVRLLRGDLCECLAGGSLDALVSNPPYLTRAEFGRLDPSVRDWEPVQALVGGTDGMEVTTRILEGARRVVRPGGWVALEVDCHRASACAARAGALGWTEVVIQVDLFGRERYLLARRSDTQ